MSTSRAPQLSQRGPEDGTNVKASLQHGPDTRTPLARIILSSLRGRRRGHDLDLRLDRLDDRQALQLARLDTLTAVI